MSDEEVKVVQKIEVAPEQVQDLSLEKEQAQESKEAQKPREVEPQKVEDEKPQDAPEVSVLKVAPDEPTQIPIKKDEILADLEDILADDLTEIFLELPDDKKLAFKQKGEEVAQKIREMVHGGKFKIGKALSWIRDWLRMIPGVNKYFID